MNNNQKKVNPIKNSEEVKSSVNFDKSLKISIFALPKRHRNWVRRWTVGQFAPMLCGRTPLMQTEGTPERLTSMDRTNHALADTILSEERIQLNALLPGDERDANNVWMSEFRAPVTNCVPLLNRVKLGEVYCQVMMHQHYGKLTEQLRAIEDVKKQKKFKLEKLDFVTPSGVFKYRREEKLVRHSGLLCIDIDAKENPDATRDLEGLKQHLLDDQDLIHDLIHVSPRGNGLKDYVRIDICNFSHLDNFKALRYYYKTMHGLVIDEACKDIVRACFLCHDPHAYVSPQICPF